MTFTKILLFFCRFYLYLKKIYDKIFLGEFVTILTQSKDEKTKLGENKMTNQRKTVKAVTRAAAIGALYVALTFISAAAGLSSGAIQVRLSEALCLLPLIMPEAVAGLTLGCALANFLTGCALWDIVFGSLATFIGAMLTRLFRKQFVKMPFMGTLPTILANALIIPLVLMFVYGEEGAYLLFFATVGIGEVISAGILGLIFYKKIFLSSALSSRLH